jgi:hypothetical protein
VSSDPDAIRLLRELVEIKLAKDAGTLKGEQYERQKTAAWREAFRFFGHFVEPK